MTDFSSDVEAGVAYLKTRAEVDPHRIGLVGHSEGGIVAPMVAARNPGRRIYRANGRSGSTGRPDPGCTERPGPEGSR